MSFAIVNYTGNGSTTTYSITFPYITSSHVIVKIDNVLKTAGTDYTFPTSSTIQFTVAPANGTSISISRSSSRSTRLVDYQDGATITEAILDQDSNQLFYISQEAFDTADNALLLDTDDKYNANSKVIKNVANPVNANDAVNKTYLENTWLSTADKATLTNLNSNIASVNAVNSALTNVNAVGSDLLEPVSEINTVAVSIANVDTVGTNIANVNTVAGNNANITTVASANANISTVAGANANITAVAGQITPTNNISTVAGAVANIGTVATDIANVNTVGGAIANVNTVAGANANITTVAGANANIGTVATNIANVNSVGGSIANVNTVATNIANVNTVAGNNANINTVAGQNANITTLAGISADITTVATNAGNISTVATDIAKVITAANDLNEATSEIEVVANAIANVDTVGTNIANVNTVATNIANINAVNSNSSNINAVNSNATNINTVASANTNITSVAGSIANVNTVASNIGSVNDFSARYRVSATAPTTSLDLGDLYFDTTSNTMKVYSSGGFINAGSSVNGTADRYKYTATASQTTFTGADDNTNVLAYDAGFLDVYLNGIKLVNGSDFTASSGTSIVLTVGASASDILEVIAYGTFQLANFSITDANDVPPLGTAGQVLKVNSGATALEYGTIDLTNLNATNLTSGTLPDARFPATLPATSGANLTSLNASNLSSGTVPDARISFSSVSQHITQYDDSKLQQDLMVLALQQATDANKSAYSLSNSFIEQFEDSSGIDVATNTARNASEFVSSTIITPKYYYKPSVDYWTFTNSPTGVSSNNPMTFVGVIKSSNGSNWTYNGSQGGGIIALPTTSGSLYVTMNIGYASNDGKFGIHTAGLSDCNTTSTFQAPVNDWVWVVARTSSDWSSSNVELMYRARTAGSFTTQADTNGGTTNGGVVASNQGRLFRHNSNGYTNDYDNTHVAHLAWYNARLSDAQLDSLFNNGKTFDWTTSNGSYSPTNLRDYFKFQEGSGTTLANSGDGGTATKQSGSGSWDSDIANLGTTTFNSSGNFTSVSQTAPATVSKMGIVVLYKNNAGTATLNTDLVAQVSANNGTDFTTVTLTPRGTFSSGISIAVANNVTVTSGTSCKYKISFANQSAGVKETQVHGIGLLY